MSVLQAIRTAKNKAVERGWDHIFVAVDWHDTICRATYGDTAMDFYPAAIVALKALTDNPQTKLILFTSSYEDSTTEFVNYCEEEFGIYFDYINENPEVENTKYGCFQDKFYYDVLLDDKAGFDPATDWYWFTKGDEVTWTK